MRKTREILRLKWQQDRSHREIARALAVGVGTPSDVAKRARGAGLANWDAVEALSDDELDRMLYRAPAPAAAGLPPTPKFKPDPAQIHIELRRQGVTLRLLHEEYLQAHPGGYGYTQYVALYNTWAERLRVVMRQVHKAGEKCFVDYSGKKPSIIDPTTGERVEVELFVAVMGASNFTYAEVTATQQSADWIASHVRLLTYLGGVPRAFVPDQLKSGVVTVRTVTDGTISAQFRYDAFGEVQELDLTGTTSTDTRHDRRYGALIAWRDEAGASVLSRQIPPGGLVATRHGAGGSWVFAFGEARGNRFFTDESGNFVQDVKYQPFGEPSSTGAQPGSHQYSNMQWNGGDALAALGLSHLGARLYDPVIGRFLSRDPLLSPRTAATTNPYAFANNDPVNSSDPSGLEPNPNGDSTDGGDFNPIDPRDVARLDLLAGTYVAHGLHTAVNAVGDAIGDASNAVSNFFGFGGGHSEPTRIDPAAGRSLMRVIDSPSPQFAPDRYLHPDDLPSSRCECDGSPESMARARVKGTAALAGLAALSGALFLEPAIAYVSTTVARWAIPVGVGSRVTGMYGQVLRDTLEKASRSSGPFTEVVTRLNSFPEAGRALSVAIGQNAQNLANAAGSGRQLFTARIPTQLLMELEHVGLILPAITSMNGAQSGEMRFLPQATEFVVRFFK